MSTKGVVVVVIVGEIRIRPRRKKKEKKGETEVQEGEKERERTKKSRDIERKICVDWLLSSRVLATKSSGPLPLVPPITK